MGPRRGYGKCIPAVIAVGLLCTAPIAARAQFSTTIGESSRKGTGGRGLAVRAGRPLFTAEFLPLSGAKGLCVLYVSGRHSTERQMLLTIPISVTSTRNAGLTPEQRASGVEKRMQDLDSHHPDWWKRLDVGRKTSATDDTLPPDIAGLESVAPFTVDPALAAWAGLSEADYARWQIKHIQAVMSSLGR